MSARQLLPPEFDLPAGTMLDQRWLLEATVARAAARRAVVRPRMIALAAAVALAVLLVTPAFGLGQKLVDVLSPQSLGPVFGKRDQATRARGESTRAPSEATRPQGKRASVPGDSAVERTARAGRPPSARRPRTARRPLSPRGAGPGGVVAGAPYTPPAAPGRPSADLSVLQRSSDAPASVGEELTRWVVVRNRGPAPAAGVVVRASLPAGTDGLAVTAPHGGCEQDPTGVVCRLGTIARGGTKTVRIVARAPSTPTRLVGTATVSARTSDPRIANNTSTATTVVRQAFVRGRGLLSLHGGTTVEVVVDAVATSGRGGETGQGTFSIRYSGGWSIAVSGRVTCLSVGGNQARVFGIVEVSNEASFPNWLGDGDDVISIGEPAALGFTDNGPLAAGRDTGFAHVDIGHPGACPSGQFGGVGESRFIEGDFAVGFMTP